jgi:transcriptional regulator with XRE-family HTH domain
MTTSESGPHTAGRNFKARRIALGLSRNQLAKQSGVGVQTIVRFEQYGSTPVQRTLRRLSMATGIPISQLIDDDYDDGEATGHAN